MMHARAARRSAAARALVWHGPPHAVMLGVMVLAMAPGAGAAGHLAGCAALTILALGLAPFAKRRRELHPVLLDLGAMAIVLAALALAAPASGHAHGVDGLVLAALTTAVWLIARLSITHGSVSAATGALSGVSLVGMALLSLA